MKSIVESRTGRGPVRWGLWLSAATALLAARETAPAAISEPDNLVYGSIVISNTAITAQRTDVVVEARRTVNGPAVASYRMGAQAGLGDFYALRLRLESLPPLTEPDASQSGESLFIVASDAGGARAQGSIVVGERGQAQRLDLGGGVLDSDGDGLPDAWELLHFGNLNQGRNSINLNGQSTLANFIAGTDPNVTNSGFRLNTTITGQQRQVWFLAMRAEGQGYEGKQRFYSLEASTNLAPPFAGVMNFTNLPGNNQVVTFDVPGTNRPLFVRGRVWLQ